MIGASSRTRRFARGEEAFSWVTGAGDRSLYRVPPYPMSHTIAAKQQIIARVRRIAGQLGGVERALEEEAGCEAVLHLVAGARGAMNGLMEEILADFVREHVAAPRLSAEARRAAADELIAIIRRYAK